MRCERLEVLLPDQKPPEVRDKFLEEEGSCTVNNVKHSTAQEPGCPVSKALGAAARLERGARSRLHRWGLGVGHRTGELSWREGQNSGVRGRAWEGIASAEYIRGIYKSTAWCQAELGEPGKVAEAHTVSEHS